MKIYEKLRVDLQFAVYLISSYIHCAKYSKLITIYRLTLSILSTREQEIQFLWKYDNWRKNCCCATLCKQRTKLQIFT